MNQKIKTSFGVIIILIIVATAGMFIWRMQKNNPIETPAQRITQPVTKSVPTDETAGWQTYKNDKYGFEFKYPSKFSIEWDTDYTDLASIRKNDLADDSIVNPATAKEGEDFLSMSLLWTSLDEYGYRYSMNVTKTNEKDINSWFWSEKKRVEKITSYEGVTISPRISVSEDFKVGNVDGVKIQYKEFPYSDSVVAFIYKGNLYTLANNNDMGKLSEINEGRGYFDQMVASFKFL